MYKGTYDGYWYIAPVTDPTDVDTEHPYDSLEYAEKALNNKHMPELYAIVQVTESKETI